MPIKSHRDFLRYMEQIEMHWEKIYGEKAHKATHEVSMIAFEVLQKLFDESFRDYTDDMKACFKIQFFGLLGINCYRQAHHYLDEFQKKK